MRVNKNVLCLLIALIILPLIFSSVKAGDSNKLNIIGFSKDGKFMAFEEYGNHDGSGFAFSYYSFINVEKNSYAAPRYVLDAKDEKSSEAVIRQQAKIANAKTLQNLKIVVGNVGTQIVSHLLTDLTNNGDGDESTPEKVRFAEDVIYSGPRGDYELTVKPIPTETADCKTSGRATFKAEISLFNKEKKTTTMLQKDDVLPKTRGCVTRYRIQDVYTYGDNVITFINVFSPGFEGDDMKYMVVTGKLK